eukprot:gnl/TRDRNA2_/TRDRNA2_90007_c0_seq1.p1 gnl/TRDRNA2_/TRDRNA2_90007_c0~~gnl/TRDRNA2_/TRDRNA2_90007_c0_seq1.p1  ORF type:complete len:442 (+),score=71.95 gnl/TRDRNA2_/TRDRNA2_90007_c0_seq1:89-1414(+)
MGAGTNKCANDILGAEITFGTTHCTSSLVDPCEGCLVSDLNAGPMVHMDLSTEPEHDGSLRARRGLQQFPEGNMAETFKRTQMLSTSDGSQPGRPVMRVPLKKLQLKGGVQALQGQAPDVSHENAQDLRSNRSEQARELSLHSIKSGSDDVEPLPKMVGRLTDGMFVHPALQVCREESAGSSGELLAANQEIPMQIQLRRKDRIGLPPSIASHDLYCNLAWKVPGIHPDLEPLDVCISCVKFGIAETAELPARETMLGAVNFASETDNSNGITHSEGGEINGKIVDDCERINFKLSSLQGGMRLLFFVASICEEGSTTFRDVQHLSLSLFSVTLNQELCRFDKAEALSGNAVVVAMLFREGENWYFEAIDEELVVPKDMGEASYRALEPRLQQLASSRAPTDSLRGYAAPPDIVAKSAEPDAASAAPPDIAPKSAEPDAAG